MELVAYTAMAIGAGVALATRRPVVTYAWFGLFVIYSIAARLSPDLTGDMRRYYETATNWPAASFYILREPVLWYGSAILYRLLGSEMVAFLAIDIASGVVVFHSMRTLDRGDHCMIALAPTILSSYVIVLGQQNGYRQYTSFVLFLWSIAIARRSRRSSLVVFGLSFFTHNVTAILFGYWLDAGRGKARRYGPWVTLCGVVLLSVLWPYLRKSSSYTGLDTSFWYVLLVGGLVSLLIFVRNGRFGQRGDKTSGISNFLGFAPAIWVLASDQFERVAMYFLILIVVDLNRQHLVLGVGRGVMALLSYLILVLPVFMFVNVYSKLL